MSDLIVKLLKKHYDTLELIRDISYKIDYNEFNVNQAVELLAHDYVYFIKKIPDKVYSVGVICSNATFQHLIIKHPEVLTKFPLAYLRSSNLWTKHAHVNNKEFLSYVQFSKMQSYDQLNMLTHFKIENILRFYKVEDFKYNNVRDIVSENVDWSSRISVTGKRYGKLSTFAPFYDRFSGTCWGELLVNKNHNIRKTAYNNCRWDAITGTTMVKLMIDDKDKYAKHLNLNTLSKSAWDKLVTYYPEYSNTEEYFAFKLRGKKQ